MTTLTKPYDLALTLVCRLEQQALATGSDAEVIDGFPVSATRTPTGKVTFRVGLIGRAVKKADLIERVTDLYKYRAECKAKRDATVPMVADVNYCEGHEVHVTLKGTRLLYLRGTYNYYHVGAMPRGQSGRKVHGGEMVPGPWAFTHQRATVLSDSKALRDRDTAERMSALPVSNGDVIWVDGVRYEISVEREYINLVPVDTSN